MLLNELEWHANTKGTETAVVDQPDGGIFLAMKWDMIGSHVLYDMHHYRKGGVDPASPSRSWIGLDALSAQCVLYEVFG